MGRVFVIGDIHGAYRALRQCLASSRFDYDNDHLICLGDVADGWPDTKASIDELSRIKNLTYILGNHDWWALQWMIDGTFNDAWYTQGGQATIDSYAGVIPPAHIEFLSEAPLSKTNSSFTPGSTRPGLSTNRTTRPSCGIGHSLRSPSASIQIHRQVRSRQPSRKFISDTHRFLFRIPSIHRACG